MFEILKRELDYGYEIEKQLENHSEWKFSIDHQIKVTGVYVEMIDERCLSLMRERQSFPSLCLLWKRRRWIVDEIRLNIV